MGFKKDSKKASNFETVKPGEYEVFITDARAERSKQKGTPNINMKLKVRDDIDQEHSKQIIFHALYLTPKTEGMVHGFLDAIQVDDSYEFKYDFVEDEFMELADEIAKLAKGKAIRVKTKIDAEYDRAVVTSVKKSDIGGELEIEESQDPFANDGKPIDISDDDLPF